MKRHSLKITVAALAVAAALGGGYSLGQNTLVGSANAASQASQAGQSGQDLYGAPRQPAADVQANAASGHPWKPLPPHVWPAPWRQQLEKTRPGLVLWTYAALHLSNHALGLVSLATAEAVRELVHGVWRSLPGSLLLYVFDEEREGLAPAPARRVACPGAA